MTDTLSDLCGCLQIIRQIINENGFPFGDKDVVSPNGSIYYT